MKKIALFVGEVSAEYQSDVTVGIIGEVRRQGYSLHIFNNFGSYSPNVFHGYGEKSIIQIPDLPSYDGVILAGDTFNVEGMYEELTQMLLENTDCPVVCLRREDPRFPSISAENYAPVFYPGTRFPEYLFYVGKEGDAGRAAAAEGVSGYHGKAWAAGDGTYGVLRQLLEEYGR